MRRYLLVFFASCSAFLAGCSTVPNEVKASAEEAGAWIGKLQGDLSIYRKNMDAADAVLLAAISQAQKDAASLSGSQAELMRVSNAAGDTRTIELVGRLKTVIDGAAKDPTDLELRLKAIDERIAGLLKPTPATEPAFGQARTAVRQLGQPLPDDVRLKELKALLKKVKEDTEATRKALP